MVLASLELTSFRNLRSLSLLPTDGVNVIWGKNGMGKTSVLEAIHLLCCGRSFRSRHMDEIVHYHSDTMRLNATRAGGGHISLVKRKGALPRFVLNGDRVSSASELAQHLPIELVHGETPALVAGPPGGRRNFADRGIFLIKADFFDLRRRYDSAMRQRNRLLRQGAGDDSPLPWEQIMASTGEQVTARRQSWLAEFSDALQQVFDRADHPWVRSVSPQLELSLEPGWRRSEPLAEALARSRTRDRQLGSSTAGPHRADLRIEIAGRAAASLLSSGQCKLLACLMTLAQGQLLARYRKQGPVQLFDDLSSELDAAAVGTLCQLAAGQGGQVFMTSLTERELDAHWGGPVNKFPLEQLAEVA